jgi:hypothetical protein
MKLTYYTPHNLESKEIATYQVSLLNQDTISNNIKRDREANLSRGTSTMVTPRDIFFSQDLSHSSSLQVSLSHSSFAPSLSPDMKDIPSTVNKT